MKIVFLGTAGFAVPSLRACARIHEVMAVVTQPERPGSRGKPAPRPVADAARSLGLDVWQPEDIREPDAQRRLRFLQPQALVVAAYGQIIPTTLLESPAHGGINVHASLLPRWRGAAPVAAAILAGDSETGVSIMRMERGVDTGPVFAQRRVPIGDDATTPALTATLAECGAHELLEVLRALSTGGAVPSPQDDSLATYAPRLTRAGGFVDWRQHSGTDVDRRVRALQPWPGVVAPLAGETVAIIAGAPVRDLTGVDAGTVLRGSGESVVVAASEDGYRIDLVKPPGRREMSPAAFLRGRRGTGVR